MAPQLRVEHPSWITGLIWCRTCTCIHLSLHPQGRDYEHLSLHLGVLTWVLYDFSKERWVDMSSPQIGHWHTKEIILPESNLENQWRSGSPCAAFPHRCLGSDRGSLCKHFIAWAVSLVLLCLGLSDHLDYTSNKLISKYSPSVGAWRSLLGGLSSIYKITQCPKQKMIG